MILVTIPLHGCAHTLWRIHAGSILSLPAEPSAAGPTLIVERGQGGPGGVPLGSSDYHSWQRLSLSNGRPLASFETRRRLPHYLLAILPSREQLLMIAHDGQGVEFSVWRAHDPFDKAFDKTPTAHSMVSRTPVRLLSLFPRVVLGVATSAGEFIATEVTLQSGAVRRLQWPCGAGAVRCVNQRILIVGPDTVECRDFDGGLIWRQAAIVNEYPGTAGLVGDVPTTSAVTMVCASRAAIEESRPSVLICRDLDSGLLRWRKELPPDAWLKFAAGIGTFVFVVYRDDSTWSDVVPTSRAPVRWFLFDENGDIAAEGAELVAGRSSSSALEWVRERAGLAFDFDTQQCIFGGRSGAVLVADGSVRRIAQLPGVPVAMGDGCLVLDDGDAIIGVARESLRFGSDEAHRKRE